MSIKDSLQNLGTLAGEKVAAFMKLDSDNLNPSLNLEQEIGPFKKMGYAVIILFVVIGLLWGVMAPLEGAAVASGKIIVSTNSKKVQHLEGGIVAALHVKEGQTVTLNQPLVDLMDVSAKSRHMTIENNLIAAYAKVTRLLAERDNKPTLEFDWPKVSDVTAKKIPDLRKQELEIITYRRNEVKLKRRELNQQIQQLKNDAAGLKNQLSNLQSKLKLSRDRLKMASDLRKDQLFSQDQYLTLQIQETETKSQLQQLKTQQQNIIQEVERKEIEYENVVNLYQKMIVEELQVATEELQTLKEQKKELGDVLGRTLIRASQAGVIIGLTVTNIGQVIAPAEVLMEIVPQDDSLIIEARVLPQDIDNVYVGQSAKIVLVPYRTRYLPTIMAQVEHISPDAFTDQQTGESYYNARLIINKEYLEPLEEIQLYPGMPTEVFLVTESRSMFNYLLDPLRQSFRRSFREE